MTTRMLRIAASTCFLLLIPAIILFAQVKKAPPSRSAMQIRHREVASDPYVAAPRSARMVSAPYSYTASGFTITQVNVDNAGQNIVGDAANEPTIAVDPKNPARVAVAWRQFNTISNNFRQAGYAYTTDGGATWTFPGVIEPGIFRSDPVLSADADGNFYYNSLTSDAYNNFTCAVFLSTDGGMTWGSKTAAHGGDKQWMIVDKTTGIGRGNAYAFWTQYWSSCLPGSFTRGVFGGSFYQDCVEIPNNPFWGTLAVNRAGELYIGGWGDTSFVVVKSSTARDVNQTVTWNAPVPVSLDGAVTTGTDPNPGGLAGQAWVAVDTTTGPGQGNVYLLCSVQRSSVADPLDVMFSRSTDGGLTWSAPHRINDDTGTAAWQWFGTMSVAPTGRIDAVWLDTRDNPGTSLSSLYYSASFDGGVSWSKNVRLSDAFDPHLGWPQQSKMGDYFHMVSDSNGARLAWAATFNGEQDVYYSWISDSLAGSPLEVAFEQRWNLVSDPADAGGRTPATLYPMSISRAFTYDGSSYVPRDTLVNGTGYWLKFGSAGRVIVSGQAIHDLTVPVKAGWNMIGSISEPIPVSSLTSEPPGMITSQFFGYTTHYVASGTIVPGSAYWVKTGQDGSLNLSSPAAGMTKPAASRIRVVTTGEMPPPPPEQYVPASERPAEYSLGEAYPNPFNPSTTIRYQLPVESRVTIRIYNGLGQVIAILARGTGIQQAGTRSLVWNASATAGGIYFCRMDASSAADPTRMFTSVKKLVLIR